jgi:glycosyltransferase involved in cell wall biosynthesis
MSPSLSVVISSLNGADGVRCCLRALDQQTIRPDLEVIVVDDGSADDTSDAGRAGGAVVITHDRNRGASAARNSGLRAASAPLVAFLDDDCEPMPDWAERLLAGYADADVIGVGGSVAAEPGTGIMADYLGRHNPIMPQEQALAASGSLLYRFWLYLGRQWRRGRPVGYRAVAMLPSANLSARRDALLEVAGFDERITFGSEDDDLCRRLLAAFPGGRLMYEPEACVVHHFGPGLTDLMRRSRAYGRGSAIMYRKWPDVRPTVYPYPAIVLAVLVAACWFPPLAAVAAVLPQLCYPGGLRDAVVHRKAGYLLDAYLQLLQEASDNLGFLSGWWRYRGYFAGEPAVRPLQLRSEGPAGSSEGS